MHPSHPTPAVPGPRSRWRSVVVPTEHGGWGLTLEPAVLGLLVAPSGAGACLAVAALVAFLARTPLKAALVDRHRKRRLARTRVAERVVLAEALVLGGLVAVAALTARAAFWVPALIALPLVALAFSFDVRSRSRRLVPELAGAIGINAVVAMIVLADDGGGRLAAALWLVLAARALTSIPWVRAQIARLHGRPPDATPLLGADLAAVAVAAGAAALDGSVVAGAVAVAAVVGLQRLSERRPVSRAAILGIHQMILGFGVVTVTALGVAGL